MGYYSYSTMGGFERGRDSYVPEVKDKPSTGIMTPSEPNNEADNNSFVSNVTNTAKALFSAVRGSAIGPASMLNIALGLAGGEGQATEKPVVATERVKSNQFKLGTGDFKFTESSVPVTPKDAGIMRKPYEAQRMLDANKPKGKGTIADQLNAFRRIERQNNKSVWGPVHSQYYQQADEYMGLSGIPKPEIKPQLRPQKLMDQTYLKISTTPKARNQAAMDKLPSVVSSNTETLTVSDFENDTAFQEAFKRINKKHGVEKNELYAMMFKESSFKPSVQNRKSKAVGLFQFLPGVLADRHDSRSTVFPDVTAFAVQTMTPAEQLDLYSNYLDSWNYTPGTSLGMMQAAPSRRTRKGSDVVYAKGSVDYEQNPGWIDAKTGLITVDSINAYYADYPGLFPVSGKGGFISKTDFPKKRP